MEETCINKKVKEETSRILEKYPKEKNQLIAILNDVQEIYQNKHK